MKYGVAILTLIFSLVCHAQFEPDNEYMDFPRELFGQEISPGLFEITKPKAFDARLESLGKDENASPLYEFAVKRGTYGGGHESTQGNWLQIIRRPLAEPSYELPSIFIFSIPKSTHRYAVLGLTADIDTVIASEDSNGIKSLVIVSTASDFEGSAKRFGFRIEFGASAKNRQLPMRLLKF